LPPAFLPIREVWRRNIHEGDCQRMEVRGEERHVRHEKGGRHDLPCGTAAIRSRKWLVDTLTISDFWANDGRDQGGAAGAATSSRALFLYLRLSRTYFPFARSSGTDEYGSSITSGVCTTRQRLVRERKVPEPPARSSPSNQGVRLCREDDIPVGFRISRPGRLLGRTLVRRGL
jgi:hypothetical protein